MKQQTHSPGPWTVEESRSDHKDYDVFGPDYDIYQKDKDAGCIATVHGYKAQRCKLDVQLISAAPELLEACKLMYEAWKQLMPNLTRGVVQSYELVLTKAPTACVQAIKKAGGEVEP